MEKLSLKERFVRWLIDAPYGYEKFERPAVSLEIDLSSFDDSTRNTLDAAIEKGLFLSKAEFVRNVIREQLDEQAERLQKIEAAKKDFADALDKIEKSKSNKTKKVNSKNKSNASKRVNKTSKRVSRKS
jgi:Arc/MetJ-type ribon-helix-helix transcriptional regulator